MTFFLISTIYNRWDVQEIGICSTLVIVVIELIQYVFLCTLMAIVNFTFCIAR
jgi:hypothetical protein